MNFMSVIDITPVDRIIAEIGRSVDSVVPILQALQEHYRYLPQEALERVCQLTDITPAAIAGVSTFYTRFRHRPVGQHMISVCRGTACHVKGSHLVQDALAQELHLAKGQDTDDQGKFTLQEVACLGCCTLGPVVQLDDATFGYVSPRDVARILAESRRPRIPTMSTTHRPVWPAEGESLAEIRVGLGSCCIAQGSDRVHDALCRAIRETGAPAVVKQVGCTGMCHRTPLVELVTSTGQSHVFPQVRPEDARQIVLQQLGPRGWLRQLKFQAESWWDRWYSDERESPVSQHPLNVRDPAVCSFLGPQQRLATDLCHVIDPLDLDEYLQHDGFVALRRCLTELTPADTIEEIRDSGLRGRGGAGFPTHVKWTTVNKMPNSVKYVIANGDEGDPGAFMDRMLLESVPFRVIEGLAIAARAVGATKAIFYIRAEYPLAVRRIRDALHQCRERGWLGERLLGSPFPLEMEVREGAGAFICGEETAMIHSLEGGRGTPRLRPPYPAEHGLWGAPTLINNVETLAVVPWILRHGGKAFAAFGTPTSRGTKVFALAGKVRRGGLIEVPMGVTIRQIVDEIGGGVGPGRRFKAVQIGGPSGGCLPAELADTRVDYESLAQVGAIMGSGGLVVMDDADCMVDIARYFLRFTQDQSCGKCTYCRIGTKRMLEILDRLCAGQGKSGDLDELEQLSQLVGNGSLCGLGRTAPNPVLTTLKYFRAEYEAHLEGRCPAGRCLPLIQYQINHHCIGCTICAQRCPVNAIPLTPYRPHVVDAERCTRCDTCRQVCPENAVEIVSLTRTPETRPRVTTHH